MDSFTITRTNGGVIAWTEDQVAYIIDKYVNENISLKELGKQFGCSYGTIRNLLNKNGIASKGNKRGYPRNELFFNLINTPEKAYWLGFMYADGCVHSTNYEISINITDLEHVEKFKNAIGAINHKITTTKKAYGDMKNPKPLYQFSIKDKQLHNDLIKWGCVPQKSLKLKKIPNIPRDYISHFIRGFFDGDGSIHYLKGTNNYRISFTNGSSDFLNDIQKELSTNVSLGKEDNKNTYQLQIAGKHQVMRILNYLYKDSNETIRLNRKYNTYLECSKWALHH